MDAIPWDWVAAGMVLGYALIGGLVVWAVWYTRDVGGAMKTIRLDLDAPVVLPPGWARVTVGAVLASWRLAAAGVRFYPNGDVLVVEGYADLPPRLRRLVDIHAAALADIAHLETRH